MDNLPDEMIRRLYAAKQNRKQRFLWTCPTHGETLFSVATRKCLDCFDAYGRPRRDNPPHPSPEQIAATGAGEPQYLAECATCQTVTPHWTQHGTCSVCTNTLGVSRQSDSYVARRQSTPRAEARRAGATTFDGCCPVHGNVAFSVTHGRCLDCYNTVGAVRPRSTNVAGMFVAYDGSVQPCPR